MTAEWREVNSYNIDFPQNLFIKYYDGQELSNLPAGWEWISFSDAAMIKSNLVDPKLTPDDIHLAPNHIESNTGKIIGKATVAEDEVKSSKHRFYSGQIIYSKIRPYLNKVCFVDFSGVCSADMYPVESKVNSKYLLYWLLSDKFVYWSSQQQGRVVLPKINQKALNKIPVPITSNEEQKQIVHRVESLFTLADSVEKQYQQARQRTDKLTQSLLAKAFRGELVPQDPNDEPAEKLLARIQAERDKLKPKKREKMLVRRG